MKMAAPCLMQHNKMAITWLVVLVLPLCPKPAEPQWDKAIDWLVLCTEYLEAKVGPNHGLCDEHHSASGIKATLDDASGWLQDLGFASPAISANLDLGDHLEGEEYEELRDRQVANERDPRCEERYCAWLVFGLGDHGSYSWADSSLALDPFPTGRTGFEEGYGFTEVHELFHAVQHGYPETSLADELESDFVDWIIEGSAEHVARAMTKRRGQSPTGSVYLRTYDQPLHIPPTEDRRDLDFDPWSYGSWEFFDFLGEYSASTDGVEYLRSLFENLAPDQKNGLEAVEAAVQATSGRGLFEAFPEFVRRRLKEPCYFSHLGEWNGLDCVDGADNEHRFELTFPDTIVRGGHAAPAFGANGYVVRMEIPEGKAGLLTVRVPPEEDAKYLHLVVGNLLYDEAAPYRHRNEHFKLLSQGRHEFFVRLVHAPPDLSNVGIERMSWDPAPIEFMLIERSARVQVSGSESATLDDVLFSYLHPNVNPQAVAREITPDLAERYADHAGLDTTTEQGRQAREQIRAAIAEAQPPLDSAELAAPEGKPAECTAIITLFNDRERAVARVVWEGGGPLLDGEHDIQATYAHGLHDAIYAHIKQLGQELALMDDPEALATWGAEFQGLTIPGVRDIYRREGAGDPFGLLDQLANIPLMQPREGSPPPPRPGQESLGRQYGEGRGKLWTGKSHGEKVQGALRFTASGEGGTVTVEGDFTAIPGPIMSRFLQPGCEEPLEDAEGTLDSTRP